MFSIQIDKLVFIITLVFGVIGAAMPAHAQQYGGGYYNGQTEARRVQQVMLGEVLDIRAVKLSTSDWGSQSAGTAIGGVIGGAAGMALGKDGSSARTILGLVGAAAGAIAGNKVANSVSEKDGVEFLVKLQDGRTYAITQQMDSSVQSIQVGSQVRLQDMNGTVRVVPLRAM